MATTVTSTVQPPVTHPATGLPVQRVATFAVGDMVTMAILSDGYPGVVVAIEGKGKTVYVQPVNFVVGNATENSHANYLDDTTLVIDPESVEDAMARGKDGARKYVLRVYSHADTGASFVEKEKVGADARGLHRARWAVPGGQGGSLQAGARYRQDPHV